MKKQVFSFLLIFLFAFIVSSQTNEARKIDEFNSVNHDGLRSRLDSLAIEVNNHPASKGYIIVYTGKFIIYKLDNKGSFKDSNETILPRLGQSNANIECMMKHLLGWRNMPKEKLLFISGGYRELYTVELWLVPNGITLKPSPTLTEMKYRKGKPVDICSEI
jgi:hypothetical protein